MNNLGVEETISSETVDRMIEVYNETEFKDRLSELMLQKFKQGDSV